MLIQTLSYFNLKMVEELPVRSFGGMENHLKKPELTCISEEVTNKIYLE